MKHALVACLIATLLLPPCALAHGEFDGEWGLDPPTLRISHGAHTVISLQNGMYQCEGCNASIVSVKADGVDHVVVGDSDIDTLAVDVVDEHVIRVIGKKSGKVVSTSTDTAAADGRYCTVTFADSGTRPRSGVYVMRRVGARAPGQHPVAGTWTFDHYERLTDPTDVIELEVLGDTVTVGIGGTHEKFTATIGGRAVPFKYRGAQHTTVSVQRAGKHGLRETFMKHGKITLVRTVTVLPGGRVMRMTVHNLRTGAVLTMLHDKR